MMAIAQSALFNILPFLLVITSIIVVHEFGHFLMARAFGVAVNRFSIGFGPTLAARRDRGGVEWRLAALPLGGYVRFAGDENEASFPTNADLVSRRAEIVRREGPGAELKYFAFKPLWQRMMIVLAGPATNFLLAVALFAALFGLFGYSSTAPVIARVDPGSAAAEAGFQAGDKVLAADGRRLASFEDVAFYVQPRMGVPIDFTVDRGGRKLEVTARPARRLLPSPAGGTEAVGMLGLAAKGGPVLRPDLLEALGLGAQKTWDVTTTTVFYLGRLVTGGEQLDQLHGFIGIAHASGSLTREGIARARDVGANWLAGVSLALLPLMALISISVGLLNLLPVPVLDGGHLLFQAYEAVMRRPPGALLQAAGYRLGLALVVSLMLVTSWNDLQRLRVFHLVSSLFS